MRLYGPYGSNFNGFWITYPATYMHEGGSTYRDGAEPL